MATDGAHHGAARHLFGEDHLLLHLAAVGDLLPAIDDTVETLDVAFREKLGSLPDAGGFLKPGITS